MSDAPKILTYQATDTAALFHADDSFVRILFGVVGCGKSVSGMEEILSRAMQQQEDDQGIRRTKWAVIRNTYPDLKSTTIATWLMWYPESTFGRIKWDAPIKHHLKFSLDDGTRVDCEVNFIAMDSPDDVRKLMSGEFTGIYINELQFINYRIFEKATERVNRYPSKIYGVPITWTGVIADTNPPDNDHWIYKRIDTNPPANYKMFKYSSPLMIIDGENPSGVRIEVSKDGTRYCNNPNCDYRWIQQDPDYWLNLVSARTDAEIKVNLMGQYGYVQDGKPVHSTFNDNLHYVNRKIIYNPAIRLGLGWDFGLTPACALMQLTARGQLLCIGEIYSEDMGLRDFVTNAVLPHLDQNFIGWRNNYISSHDPAGSQRTQTEANTCQQVLAELGILSAPAASTNNAAARRDGLKYFLGKMTDGLPGFQVSMDAPMIRKGLGGAFKYARMKVGGDERYHEEPLKNLYSHICEAAEYIAMYYAPVSKKPASQGKRPSVILQGDPMGH